MKLTLALLLAVSLTRAALAAQPKTVELWPNGAPGALGTALDDRPSLTLYLPERENASQTGVLVCPGGGYVHLAMDHEGVQIARWLNQRGLAAFVLKYRLGPRYHHPVQMEDGRRAMRYVRSHAAEFGIRADRIGVWGFSAGGHMASTLGTHFDSGNPAAPDPIDRAGSRPDFMILAYPVITMKPPYAHQGSRNALLGDNPAPELVDLMSNELQVTAQTPPTFIFQTTNDNVVPVENSLMFYQALLKNHVPAEMHLYEQGPHGVGLAQKFPELATWPGLLEKWLELRGLLQ